MKDKNIIKFTVLGSPKALKRHRTFRRGNFVGSYDPSLNDKADFLAKCRENAPKEPWDEPIKLTVDFYFDRPKVHFNSRGQVKDSASRVHTSRPDIDNCIKLIMDALNKIYWHDDSQICILHAYKRYNIKPRIDIEIEKLDKFGKEVK